MTAQDLPSLKGSDKQIAWATKIRDTFFASQKVAQLITMIETNTAPNGAPLTTPRQSGR